LKSSSISVLLLEANDAANFGTIDPTRIAPRANHLKSLNTCL
jgi:hypothetical protein